ncbi:MAG: CHAT domain-containing protein [Candidatus Magnetomorum sp.]|nr:CHAT domain-containing protein [Candidatus Magnetomorum sp.]
MTNEQTICLEASYWENQIKIGIQQPKDMVWHYDTLPVSITELDDCVLRLTENINQMVRAEGQTASAHDKIKTLGQRLCDSLLTSDIKTFLRKSRAQYLVLKLDDTLVSIPWELICIDNHLLCERFCMGRIVKTHQSVAQTASRNIAPPLNMWILSENDTHLTGVDQEAQALLCQLDQLNQSETLVNAAFDQGVTVDHVKSHLRNFDLVHFAGHADYDSSSPEQNGWRIGNEHLTAIDIDRMSDSTSMPALIFSNACQSARTQQWTLKNVTTDASFDLANAFMRSGVRHYLGTFWEIPDQSSSIFSLTFYKALFSGQSIGQSLKQARKKCMETDGSPIGAAYVLYGDPTVTYFSETSADKTIQTRGAGFRPFHTIKQKIQALPFNAMWFFLCIVLLMSGLWVGHAVIDVMMRNQQMEYQTLLNKRAKEKQVYIDRLFDDIEQLTGQTSRPISKEPVDEWTSALPTLSIDYETHPAQLNQAQLSLIAAVIGKALIDDHRAVVLERVHLDKILQELKRANSGLIAKDNRILPELLSARLIVFIELHQENNQTTVLVHLADIRQGHVIDYFFHPLKDMSILKQKDFLARPLIQSVTHHYPLRAKIQDIQDQSVQLNIGSKDGVRSGVVFNVLKNNCRLTVDTIDLHSSVARISKPQIKLERGWKVEAIR